MRPLPFQPALAHTFLLVSMLTPHEKHPGKQRLEVREQIQKLSVGGSGKNKVSAILNTRMRSALQGHVVLGEQPSHLRTGLSPSEEGELVRIASAHFSYGPLSPEQERAFSADLAAVGISLAQGYGLRNHLLGRKREEGKARLAQWRGGTEWGQMEACATQCDCAPTAALRHFLILCSKPRLSPKLASSLVESIVAANDEGHLCAHSVLSTRRFKRLTYGAQRALRRVVSNFDESSFWAAAEWACSHDVQGRPKQLGQRKSRAIERLAISKLRATGVRGREEKQLQLRTTTPDLIVDKGPPGVRGRASEAVHFI